MEVDIATFVGLGFPIKNKTILSSEEDIKMQINRIAQLHGKYIKGNISRNIATLDSLHILLDNNSRKVNFSRPELEKLIEELMLVCNELEEREVPIKYFD